MGWWKVQDSNDVVGDEVFSMLRNAALEACEEYRKELGRSPTRSEWERLLHEAIQPVEDLEGTSADHIVAESKRPGTVRILLE